MGLPAGVPPPFAHVTCSLGTPFLGPCLDGWRTLSPSSRIRTEKSAFLPPKNFP